MSNGTVTSNGNGNGRMRWAGLALTGGLAVAALIVQWGVVTTKLDQVEKRLDELIYEARSLRNEYQGVERRLSYVEGRLNGEHPSSTPRRTGP
jgi:hypothetical protein